MKIYLGGSMAGGREFSDSLKLINGILEKLNHKVISPFVVFPEISAKRFPNLDEKERARAIFLEDKELVQRADVAIFEVSQASHGVGYEHALADFANKKILLLVHDSLRNSRQSMFLSGPDNPDSRVEYYNKNNIQKILEEFLATEQKKGKFIVIEGTDGSGKTTQFNFLHERLIKEGMEPMIADFPRYYDSVWGKMIGEYLVGKYGKFTEVHPRLSVLMYMLDEYTWSRDVGKDWIRNGNVIISNRFFTSNVHQVSKMKTVARKKYREWLWPTGYEKLGILKPDLVIFLDIPPAVSRKMNQKKEKREYLGKRKKDVAEANYGHQVAAHKEYLHMVKSNKTWKRVSCMNGKKVDTPENIHEKVWKIVAKELKQ